MKHGEAFSVAAALCGWRRIRACRGGSRTRALPSASLKTERCFSFWRAPVAADCPQETVLSDVGYKVDFLISAMGIEMLRGKWDEKIRRDSDFKIRASFARNGERSAGAKGASAAGRALQSGSF